MIAVPAEATPRRQTRASHARVPTLTPRPDRPAAQDDRPYGLGTPRGVGYRLFDGAVVHERRGAVGVGGRGGGGGRDPGARGAGPAPRARVRRTRLPRAARAGTLAP